MAGAISIQPPPPTPRRHSSQRRVDAMGKKKSADPNAPMPNLRDQGGLAAVARMVQQQRELEASVPAQGVKIANPPAFQPGFLDRKPAKKEKKEKKDKKDKKEKKEKKEKK